MITWIPIRCFNIVTFENNLFGAHRNGGASF